MSSASGSHRTSTTLSTYGAIRYYSVSPPTDRPHFIRNKPYIFNVSNRQTAEVAIILTTTYFVI